MLRFFAAPEQFREDRVYLDNDEAHHIKKVMRLGTGAVVRIFDGQGREYEVELIVERGAVWGRIIAQVPAVREPELKVTLAQGLAKGEKNELVIQKATEVGVQAIIPLICERSVMKLSPGRNKEERLRRVAREAAKQCQRSVVPTVEAACRIKDIVTRFSLYDTVLLLWEEEQACNLKQTLQELRQKRAIKQLLVLVGPEGGFTAAEAQEAIEHGAYSVSLGPRILRTETAGLVALSAIFYEFDELSL
ncbi:MAG: 16S rRNA (uracil(1498)-N(3))-methyltransferase [Firmicutes bacterium]|jgi:16S rRNA (uracil1498-N3)-methyltransferase|nr:16S rRNA (uracil(1498)-N(3))-methyltransferase [Bacillota bacterium]